jgi:hypothetical protein
MTCQCGSHIASHEHPLSRKPLAQIIGLVVVLGLEFSPKHVSHYVIMYITGDSVALLARGGACQRLTVDHRADNAAEMLRVLNAGGELEYDDCGTLRLYRPTDAERKNGCMFTRCAFVAAWCGRVLAEQLSCTWQHCMLFAVACVRNEECQKPGMRISASECTFICECICRMHLALEDHVPCLLCCRSLGDFNFKQPRPLLLCEPHVVHQQLAPSDSLLLLASDGVTDSLGDNDVMCIAMRALEQVGFASYVLRLLACSRVPCACAFWCEDNHCALVWHECMHCSCVFILPFPGLVR